MLLCCYMFRHYKAIFRQNFFKDSNSLYASHIVFFRYVVDVHMFWSFWNAERKATPDMHNEKQHI
jgi:low temperature requirement protein LtrA